MIKTTTSIIDVLNLTLISMYALNGDHDMLRCDHLAAGYVRENDERWFSELFGKKNCFRIILKVFSQHRGLKSNRLR